MPHRAGIALDRFCAFCEHTDGDAAARCEGKEPGGAVIEVGDTLAGKYRVLAELGAGGMGRVFRAENMLTGKQVALKCLHAHLTAGADASERLLREARAVSSLTHSNVVDVYDVVRDAETLFLVMELLKGETLRAYLLRNPHPKISEFLAMILPAMSGVEAAHQCGVIHRDLITNCRCTTPGATVPRALAAMATIRRPHRILSLAGRVGGGTGLGGACSGAAV